MNKITLIALLGGVEALRFRGYINKPTFKKFDNNTDRYLQRAEYLEYCRSLGISQRDAEYYFDAMDYDWDDKLDITEATFQNRLVGISRDMEMTSSNVGTSSSSSSGYYDRSSGRSAANSYESNESRYSSSSQSERSRLMEEEERSRQEYLSREERYRQ